MQLAKARGEVHIGSDAVETIAARKAQKHAEKEAMRQKEHIKTIN